MTREFNLWLIITIAAMLLIATIVVMGWSAI
jgi:hypothetical protein